MFGKHKSGAGHYVRRGGGRGMLRFSLRYSAGDHLNTLLQVCDGQRIMTISDIGDRKIQAEVDLSRIRSRLEQMGLSNQSLSDPIYSIYLAVGSQSEVLRTLCQRYRWHSVTESTLDGVPVWKLLGTLASDPPLVHGLAPIDRQLFAASQSRLSPTHVEASISTDAAAVPYWLYQVVYSKPPASEIAAGGDNSLHTVTEWYSPELLSVDALEDQLFLLPPASGASFTDETDKYLPPLNLASQPDLRETQQLR